MSRAIRMGTCTTILLLLGVFTGVPASHAGPFDGLKKKAGKEATKTADKAVEEGVSGAAGEISPKESGEVVGGTPAGEKSAPVGGSSDAKPGSTEKVSAVSTKFDFVSGDSLLFFDDFTQDELGEFPSRWRLKSGTFEVAEMNGERWLRCTSDDGHIRMKVPPSLPEFWTFEFETHGVDVGAYLTVSAMTEKGDVVWETMFPHSGANLRIQCGDIFSTTPLEGSVPGRHRVMYMGRGSALKAYMDRQRLVSIPDIGSDTVAEFDIRLWAPNHSPKPMITGVRFAEGCRPAKDLLAEGKLVTYGIHFDTGSDVVRPESAPVLHQIASYLEGKPDVKLRITGHTDNVGGAASNLDLSKRRAAAVAAVLSGQFGIAADRFQTEGNGDTQPVASNVKPEGRAKNRRVEFTRQDAATVVGTSSGSDAPRGK
jgi:OmpA-OmpF porin, OOP family